MKKGTFLTPPFQIDVACRLFLGENVFANHGLTVMSVGTVTRDVPPRTVVAGVPAKVIKTL